MSEPIFRKGQKVKAITVPKCSLGSGDPVKVGEEGIIVGVRHGTVERLVQFGNRYIQCSTDEIKEIK